MKISYKIRPMALDDLEGVYTVQVAGFEGEMIEPISLFAENLKQYPAASFVAVSPEGEISAYIMAHPAKANRQDYDVGAWKIEGDEEGLYLHDLCVHPAAQGRGLAQRLFNALENYARQHGFEKILGVSVKDTAAFWKKWGFDMIRPHSYHGHAGKYMEKDL